MPINQWQRGRINGTEGVDFVTCRMCGERRRVISGRYLSKHDTDRLTYIGRQGNDFGFQASWRRERDQDKGKPQDSSASAERCGASKKHRAAARRARQLCFYRWAGPTDRARGIWPSISKRVACAKNPPPTLLQCAPYVHQCRVDHRMQSKVDRGANRNEHRHDSRALRAIHSR